MGAARSRPGLEGLSPAAGGVHHALAASLARDGQGPGFGVVVIHLDASGLAAAQARPTSTGAGSKLLGRCRSDVRKAPPQTSW